MKRLVTISCLLALTLPAIAHEGEKNPEIRYRHFVMEAMSNNFAAMAMLFKKRSNPAR